MLKLCVVTIAFLSTINAAGSAVGADDWPRFQGPDSTGKIEAESLNLDWGDGGPPEVWSVDVGRGYGGPAIRDGEVYILDREVGESDILRCFDLKSGEETWSAKYEAQGRLQFPGSRTVPHVTDDFVFTSGGMGHVCCFDRKKHELVWKVSMEDEYGGRQPAFGWSAAPLLYENLVIVTPLGEDCGLLALDQETGKEVWRTPGVGYSHATPTILPVWGEDHLIFISTETPASGMNQAAPSVIQGYDPATGDVLWRYDTEFTRLPIPPPIMIDEETLFFTSGYRGGSFMVAVAEDEGEYSFEEMFRIDRGAQIHVPILHDDHIYVIVNENWNDNRRLQGEGGLLCLSLDGNELWRTGASPYLGRGNMILIGDYLFIQDGYNGSLRVVNPNPVEFEVVAQANIFGITDRRDHELWSPMAFSDMHLVMRSDSQMKCLYLGS